MEEDHEIAITRLRQRVTEVPDRLDLQVLLCGKLIRAGRAEEVVELFCEMVSALPTRPQVHYDWFSELAEGRFHHAEIELALRGVYRSKITSAFSDAARGQSASGSVHYGLGIILQIGRRDAEALRCFQRVLETNPNTAAVYHNISVVLLAQGRLHEALEAGEKAVSIEPAMAEPYYLLGSIHMGANRLPESLAAFQNFVRLASTPELVQYAQSAMESVQLLRAMTTSDRSIYNISPTTPPPKLPSHVIENMMSRDDEINRKRPKVRDRTVDTRKGVLSKQPARKWWEIWK